MSACRFPRVLLLASALGIGLAALAGAPRPAAAQVRIPGDPASPGGPLGLPLGSGDPQQQIQQQQLQLQQQQRERDRQFQQQQQIQRQQTQDLERWRRSQQLQQRERMVRPPPAMQPVQGPRVVQPPPGPPPRQTDEDRGDCRVVERRQRGEVVRRQECRVCDPPGENYGIIVEDRRSRCRVISRPVG
ncbi:hypothetical protein [Phreatobacter sp. AB_2022a]|uniref:hypothetical protein n=1 Tax=Phreatobacter sp. AB_2022a TaxID=3003134 RepID=UPI0022874F6D|nr:hypothetical protein [Phreatobacter sp. AB_2022a]MCZ0737425.1 hypothetical protein [Phreatobacter sp. AB_2022a]